MIMKNLSKLQKSDQVLLLIQLDFTGHIPSR